MKEISHSYRAIVLYFLSLTEEGRMDMHRLFKLLYFADRNGLAQHGLGLAIPEDIYVKMTFGPVPSVLYDYLKSLDQAEDIYIEKDGKEILIKEVDLAEYLHLYLSAYAKEIASQVFEENRSLNFNQRTEKSHDEAWQRTDMSKSISRLDIAEAGGASEATIAYLQEVIENEAFIADLPEDEGILYEG